MPSRRIFLISLGALGLPIMQGACTHSGTPLRIASYVWPGYEFMFLAQREGWINQLEAVLVETGSATESIQLLTAGQVDGAALTLDEVLGARARGLSLVVILVFDISLGADVLLSRPGIENMVQLKDKRIGYEPSAVGALMLHKALAIAGLRPDQVVSIPVTFDRHYEAWEAGEVDALITFEPVSSHLQEKGALRLFDSSQIPDIIFDVLAVTPEAMRRKPEALRHLIAAHFRGLRNFRKNPNDTAYRMAERFRLPAKEVLTAYAGLELPNIYRNRKLLRAEDSPLVETARELSEFLLHTGILPNRLTDWSDLTSPAFLPLEDSP